MEKIYKRQLYLDKIRGFYHSDIIKVITGVRRCGKSCFMLSVIDDLKAEGVDEKDIIYINLDARGFRKVKDPDQLEKIIDSGITGSGRKYIFIDEVQNVEGFEELINGYREEGHSIFVTGSNSYLLSGELVTKLTGRYIEIEMFTLSFYEYEDMKRFYAIQLQDKMSEFTEYIRAGGFPQCMKLPSVEDKDAYVNNVVNQIFAKDIASRAKIRDHSVFERIRDYVISNFGQSLSLQNIINYLRGVEKNRITYERIHRYIALLTNAKILYECPRFDIKSKKTIRGEQKYYLADLSIFYAMNADAGIYYGPALENIMYCYLAAKGYKVRVGRLDKLECDFIVRKGQDQFYIQVSMSIAEKAAEEREYRPLLQIRDNYPKYLFTLDPLLQKRDGILHRNLIDFILNNEDL